LLLNRAKTEKDVVVAGTKEIVAKTENVIRAKIVSGREAETEKFYRQIEMLIVVVMLM